MPLRKLKADGKRHAHPNLLPALLARLKLHLSDRFNGSIVEQAMHAAQNLRIDDFPAFVHDKLYENCTLDACTSSEIGILNYSLQRRQTADEFGLLLYYHKNLVAEVFFYRRRRTSSNQIIIKAECCIPVERLILNDGVVRHDPGRRRSWGWGRGELTLRLHYFIDLDAILVFQNDNEICVALHVNAEG